MRHRKAGVKLNRTSSHRDAMFRNMVTSLFKYDRIRTTDTKAKELRRWADRMITLAKRGDLHARRQVLSVIREKDVAHKLFEEAQDRFGEINGGYTRLVKLGTRPGDAASVTLIELISVKKPKKKAKKKKVSEPEKKTEVKKDTTPETEEKAEAEADAPEVAAAPAEAAQEAAADADKETKADDAEPADAKSADSSDAPVDESSDETPAETKEDEDKKEEDKQD